MYSPPLLTPPAFNVRPPGLADARPTQSLPLPLFLPLYQSTHANPGKPFELQLTSSTPIQPGKPAWLDLHLYEPMTGRPPHLQIVHEKPAHIFIVNQDLSDFQHVHPEAVQPGLLRIPVRFQSPGAHKLFIQFTTPEYGEQTLSKPFQLGGVQPPLKPLVPDAHLPKFVNGYTFRISGLPTRQQPMSMFQVEVSRQGLPVRHIQPYLGAAAHGVILSQDARSFIHTHPMTAPQQGFYPSPIQFHTSIEKPGLYKLWVQTKIDNQVQTVDWTFRV